MIGNKIWVPGNVTEPPKICETKKSFPVSLPPRGGVQPDVMSSIHGPEGVVADYRHTQVCRCLSSPNLSRLKLKLFFLTNGLSRTETIESFLEWQSCHSFAEGYSFHQNYHNIEL